MQAFFVLLPPLFRPSPPVLARCLRFLGGGGGLEAAGPNAWQRWCTGGRSFSAFTVCARSRFEVFGAQGGEGKWGGGCRLRVCCCMTAGWGETEVHWMSRPGAWLLCSIAILLRVVCFLCSVCLEPFYEP